MVERRYRKPQVVGSIPTLGSKVHTKQMRRYTKKFASTEEQNNKKRAVFYSFLTIAALVAIYFLGIPVLGKLTNFVTSFKGNNKIATTDTTPPPPPKLRNFPEFINQQSLTLTGNTEAGAAVKLTLNGNIQESLSDNNGQFSFNITLQDGTNTFAATATDQAGNISQKTNDYQIVYDNTLPDLEVTSPNDGSGFFGSTQRQVTIQGKTEAGTSVTINDRIISVDEDGIFQYTTTLNDGTNSFTIKSTDKAGNTTEKNITLNFTP